MDFALLPISKDSFEWQCSILKLGGVTVLLNCGWTESLDPKLLSPLIPHLNELDLILLTHADVKHLGSLPYVLTKYSVACPVVCTEPVSRLGELSCVSSLEDREKYREVSEVYEVDDVLRIFMSRITPIKYRETFRIQVNGRVLAACPYPAGSHLGSAYWTLQCGSMSAVYVVDSTMRQGRYLDGLELHRILPTCRGTAQRWDVVITAPLATSGLAVPQQGALQGPEDVHAASKAITVARTVREQLFLEDTIAALRKGGTVLIPADVAGWIPEILLLFEAAWGQDRQLATNYPLVWLSSMGDMVLDQVKTRLEYMGNEVLDSFESRAGHHPFVLKNVRIFQSLEELCAAHPLSRPKVIFSTSPHLEGGDSRELFFRLCGEPKTLLWLLGIAPHGTLARQLLDDFVIGQCLRKDYRLQQHIKQPLPDEELREFYETKIQQQGLEVPLPPEVGSSMKAEDIMSVKGEDVKAKTEEAEASKVEPKTEIKSEVTGATENKLPREMVRPVAASSALWSPLGWPGSRTIAHSEARSEGDEYGHLLTNAELKTWKAQDQEGNKYSGPEGETEKGDSMRVGPGAQLPDAKLELDEEFDMRDMNTSEWRESLRLHFREPMRCEVRERSMKVVCKVRYLPDNSLDGRDLRNLLQLACPRHVVLLPARGSPVTGDMLQGYFANSSPAEASSAPPEVHVMRPKDLPLQLALRGLKRKVQISNELWPQLSFAKTNDGVRVARVRASAAPLNSDPRAAELRCIEEPSAGATGSRLPRGGALFLGLGDTPLRLSGLKEALIASEWSRDDIEIEFRAPAPQSKRPWSHRVLAAGSGAALGFVRKGRAKGSTAGQALRLEGMPSEEFFAARAAIYKRSAII